MIHFLVKYLLVLFAGGVATSYAEYKFKYNLFEDAKNLVAKVIGFFHKKKAA